MSRLYADRTPALFGTGARPASFRLSGVFRAISRTIVQPLLAAHRARVAYLELSDLDDRQLADIGLNRGTIESALTGRAPVSSESETTSAPKAATRSRAA